MPEEGAGQRPAAKHRIARRAGIALVVVLLLLAWPAYQLYDEIRKATSDDPRVYAEDIAAIEERTGHRRDEGAIVFVGSSSIRLWSSLEEDMAPLPALNHGFGGSKLHDLEYFAERLVNAYAPRAVVVFSGTNDVSPGGTKTPQELLASYQRAVETMRAADPGLPVFYIAITPSPMRFEVWPVAQETNRLIRAYTESDDALHFIDTGERLLGSDGTPDRANYRFDRLHLSKRGYAIWAEIIKPRLLAELS